MAPLDGPTWPRSLGKRSGARAFAVTLRSPARPHLGLPPVQTCPTLAQHLLRSPGVLLVGDLLHPLDDLPVQVLLDREVCHGLLGRRTTPVLIPRRNPHHVAGPDLP
jgi:hypothetical protein